jgi:hypothetical protein|tara:strand:+ start:958 stop:1161 length:204 start_codon:yes stop_codon:yes gene_type:complete
MFRPDVMGYMLATTPAASTTVSLRSLSAHGLLDCASSHPGLSASEVSGRRIAQPVRKKARNDRFGAN